MSRQVVTTLSLAIAVVATVAMSGCGGSKKQPAKVEKAKQSDMKLEKQEGPTREEIFVRKMAEVRFSATRDPFKPLSVRRSLDQDEVTTPLEQYDVAQLKLVGVVWGTASPIALVRAPDGNEYRVFVNTSLGKNEGKVVTILPDQIIIVEKFFDYRGQLQQEKFSLRLQSGPGEE